MKEIGTVAAVSLVLVAFFSPVAASRLASMLEGIASELRHHGAAMADAYAAYRETQRRSRESVA